MPRFESEKPSLPSLKKALFFYVANGYTNKELGEEFGLDLHTVRSHLYGATNNKGIINRLGAENKLDAVVLGAQAGLLDHIMQKRQQDAEKMAQVGLLDDTQRELLDALIMFSDINLTKLATFFLTDIHRLNRRFSQIQKLVNEPNRESLAVTYLAWQQKQKEDEVEQAWATKPPITPVVVFSSWKRDLHHE